MYEQQYRVELSEPIHHPPEFIRDGWYHFVETHGLYGYVKPFGPFQTEAEAIADQRNLMRPWGVWLTANS